MVNHIQPKADYAVGPKITATDINGSSAQVIAHGFVPMTETGGVALSGKPAAATATLTSVSSTAASQTIKAANTARLGLSISNTDANILYLLLGGGTASATNFTVAISGATATAIGYYEVPYGFTGAITGIWAVDGAGAALVTEFT